MDKIIEKIVQADITLLFSDENKKRGVQKYAEILKSFSSTNVILDELFQKKFNGFYRVRRNSDWQKVYYSIMEDGKRKPLTFEMVLKELFTSLGRVEASFSSKLLHTLNNDMPIWDKWVLQNLTLDPPKQYWSMEKKLNACALLYNKIVVWYKKTLSMEEIQQKIVQFDAFFPEYKWFSETKKLDFFLWQIRD